MALKLATVSVLAAGVCVCAAVGVLSVRRPDASEASHAPPRLQLRATPGRSDWRPPARPIIRVNVTPASTQRLEIAVDGPYQIRPVGKTQIVGRGERMSRSTVAATRSGLRIGGNEFRYSDVEVVAGDSPAIWVGEHQYRGSVRLHRQAGGTITAVNALPLEAYVASVIDSEMPAAFPDEARKAQAIVARTYALYQMAVSRGHPHFDVFADTRSQKYLGFQYRTSAGRRLAGETEDARRIARETAGIICTWRGDLFCTYYSAVCGGHTTPGRLIFSDAATPLRSVPCDWCRDARRYRWRTEVPASDVSRVLRSRFAAAGGPFGTLASVTLVKSNRSSAPQFPAFQFSDGRNRLVLMSRELRQCLGAARLPGLWFTARLTDGKLVVEGRGHGHGVGLCQWGARGQALAGRTHLEILQHYYPGAEVQLASSKGIE